MTRLLAWSFGASAGYVVGWLAGSNVQRMAEGRRLGRPEPRTALSAPVESPEPLNGREAGVQRCGDVDLWSRLACTLDAGHDGDHHAKAGEGSHWWWTNGPPIPTRRDDGTRLAFLDPGVTVVTRRPINLDDTDEGNE